MRSFISYPLFTLVQTVQYCTSNTVCVSCSVQPSPPSAVSCERCIRLIEFAKSCEVVAIATGDPAQDRGAVVTMTTAMAVTSRVFFKFFFLVIQKRGLDSCESFRLLRVSYVRQRSQTGVLFQKSIKKVFFVVVATKKI